MADYDDDYDRPRRYRSSRTVPRGRDDADYLEETTYVERGKGAPPRDLVRRGREDSIEDIPRDFPPPSRNVRSYRDDDYDEPPRHRRRARSAVGRRDSYDDYDDDYYAGGGAAAGYAAGRSRAGGDRRRDRGYGSYDEERYRSYSDDEDDRRSTKSGRRKSGIESALEGLGLGGVAGAITGKSRSKSRGRGERYESRSRSTSRGGPKGAKTERQWAQAAQAAIVAGAVEAFRSRKEPGPWTGQKGKRIATAAIAAGGIDRLVDKDPDHKSKRHLAEAVLGGLAGNRLVNGPGGRERSVSPSGRGRSQSRSRSIIDRFRSKSRRRSADSADSGGSRGRERSQSKGRGLKELAAAGGLAAAGKAIYDRVRSKSRGASKSRRRSPSASSEDSYEPRSRRRDVVSRRDQGNNRGIEGPAAGVGAAALAKGDPHEGKVTDSENDTSSSTDLENKRKKMRGKELLTAGLATVATIHAAHGVYQSMESSEKRHKLVAEGEMSAEEARKKRSKAWLQDAAAVGIAALGIKGAYSEWKEMNEQRHSVKELEERHRKRRNRHAKRMREAARQGVSPQELHRGGNQNNGGGGGRLPASGGYNDDYYDGPNYHDANPYSAENVPPPPMGGR